LITRRFGTAPIELAVEDLLPGPEVQTALGHRHDHLVVDEQVLEVGVPVVLAGGVVAIITGIGRQLARSCCPAHASSAAVDGVRPHRAGEPGFEPGFTVLETVRIALNSLP